MKVRIRSAAGTSQARRRTNFAAAGICTGLPNETGVLGVLGITSGAIIGSVLSVMLVRVLGGVFDPPPDGVAVPWPYLAALIGVIAAALVAVGAAGVRLVRRPAIPILREL
jgi:putative ABC transport system permease protein